MDHAGFSAFDFIDDDHEGVVGQDVCDVEDGVGGVDVETELGYD